jgi:hypothetical protein
LIGISTGSSAIPPDVPWFSPVSPEDCPDITRLCSDPFLPNHLQFIHEIISPFYVLAVSHWLRRKICKKKNQTGISKSRPFSPAGEIYCNESHLSRMPWNLFARQFTGQVQRSQQTIKAAGVC